MFISLAHGGCLSSSSPHLFSFAGCFGRPIAKMYTVVVGKQTTFSLSLWEHVERGVPDFSFQDCSGRALLVGEGKVRTAITVKLQSPAVAQPASIITAAAPASPCYCACVGLQQGGPAVAVGERVHSPGWQKYASLLGSFNLKFADRRRRRCSSPAVQSAMLSKLATRPPGAARSKCAIT